MAWSLVPVVGAASPDPGRQGNSAAHRPVCGPVPAGVARCHSQVRTDVGPLVAPVGYSPADLISAYKLPASVSGGGTPTVAIVDAFDDPNAEADLAVYRSTFGLAACHSGAANGSCFTKVGQTGGSPPATTDTGWGLEISLDVDMVSAICPSCHILLVEANSNSFNDLAAAVDFAASWPGVVAISNSYGAGEFSTESSLEGHYNHPGKAVTVSTGDNGFGVQYPAASQFVTAVGGTSLSRSANARGWTETVWSGAGSGCSSLIQRPSWQSTANTACGRRAVADVAAVANPNTGVAVYDTFGESGWLEVGGTSAGAPLIASVYALAGNVVSLTYGSFSYSHTSSLFDVVSGSNGRCRRAVQLCTGEPGWDGPTGNGTPNGTGGF